MNVLGSVHVSIYTHSHFLFFLLSSKLQAFHDPSLCCVNNAVQVKYPAVLCLVALHPWLLISLLSSLTGFLIKLPNRMYVCICVCVCMCVTKERKQLHLALKDPYLKICFSTEYTITKFCSYEIFNRLMTTFICITC